MKEKLIRLFQQFIKFGLVGVSNTAISYGIDMLGYYVVFRDTSFSGILNLLKNIGISATNDSIKVIIVTAIAFIVSVINSYFWNNRFVFKSQGKKTFKRHAFDFLKMAASYALTGLILTPFVKILLNQTEMQYWLVSILTMVLMVPLNFLLNKLWAFKDRK